MKKAGGILGLTDFREYGWARQENAKKMRRWLALLACVFLSLPGTVLSAVAGTCVESNCVVNVVWERFYAYWGIGNLYYAYVPTPQWATDDCATGSYAIDVGRTPINGEPAYLVGWTKAYYNGTNWFLLGGDPGKYFLTKTTPFHAAADVILTGTLPGQNPVIEALNAQYPNGCSDLPSQKPDQTPNFDTGRPECNDQVL